MTYLTQKKLSVRTSHCCIAYESTRLEDKPANVSSGLAASCLATFAMAIQSWINAKLN